MRSVTTYPMVRDSKTEDWLTAIVAVLRSGITNKSVRNDILDKFAWVPAQHGYGLGRTPLVSTKVASLLKDGYRFKGIAKLVNGKSVIRTHREHVYGRALLKNLLWNLKNPTNDIVWEIYQKYAVICIVTHEEELALRKLGKDADKNGLGWTWYERASISTTLLKG